MGRKGFVLIFSLWVLSFLTVLAVGLAAGIRQKIVLLEKLNERSRTSHLLIAASKYAAVYISNQINLSNTTSTVDLKMKLYNNFEQFGHFDLNQDKGTVSYKLLDQNEFFGVIDEERKININITSAQILSRLIQRVLNMKFEDSQNLAESILDWRQLGESQAKGFFSDEYYANLTYPYPKKDSNYEIVDELLLVKGMTKEWYQKLINYVTIYGNGKININTASAEVLFALGLEDSLIQKIIEVRQGKDGLEATIDDHVFQKTFDAATEVNSVIKLDPHEIRAIDQLNQQGLVTTFSEYFTIQVNAYLNGSQFIRNSRAIFSPRENRILYWKER